MKKLLLVLAIAGMVCRTGAGLGASSCSTSTDRHSSPIGVGGDLTAYLPVDEAGVIDTPIPLDFDNFDYTIVVTGLTLDVVNGNAQDYLPGSIVMYEDAATPADYGNPSTFTDGIAILSGSLYSFTRQMFTSTLGSGQGDVDWTGGTRLGEWPRPTSRAGPSSSASARARTVIDPGYDENWDGKVEPLSRVATSEPASAS